MLRKFRKPPRKNGLELNVEISKIMFIRKAGSNRKYEIFINLDRKEKKILVPRIYNEKQQRE